MGLFDVFQSNRDEFDNTHHASVTHDVLGGAVAYEVAKAWQDHCAKNGKPSSHAKAKEILAGLAGVAITHLAETKGLDAWDAHTRSQALQHAEEQINQTVIVNDY